MGKERNVPWEEILRRRKEGETARALAEEFGVSVESVYKRGQRERLEQRGSLQQAARNLCRSAGSMVAQMEDMDAKELKELTALLRELVTLFCRLCSWLDRSLLAALASSQARSTSVCRVVILDVKS